MQKKTSAELDNLIALTTCKSTKCKKEYDASNAYRKQLFLEAQKFLAKRPINELSKKDFQKWLDIPNNRSHQTTIDLEKCSFTKCKPTLLKHANTICQSMKKHYQIECSIQTLDDFQAFNKKTPIL